MRVSSHQLLLLTRFDPLKHNKGICYQIALMKRFMLYMLVQLNLIPMAIPWHER